MSGDNISPKAMIQNYEVDADSGKITLTLPHIDAVIATTVNIEMNTLRTNSPGVDIQFKYEGDEGTITLASPDVMLLAKAAVKAMARRLTDTRGPNTGEQIKYATTGGIISVMNSLRQRAESHSPHAVTVIDKAITVIRQMERM